MGIVITFSVIVIGLSILLYKHVNTVKPDSLDEIELNPDYPDAYGNRGIAKYERGDYKGALEDLETALMLAPAYKNKLQTYIDIVKEKIAEHPEGDFGLAQEFFNQGSAKAASGDQKGAIDDYNKALYLAPKDIMAYINRGNAKAALGDNKGALEDLEKALALDPFNDEIKARVNEVKIKSDNK